MSIEISGVWTALITPFRKGEIDHDGFKALIERQIEGGVSGLVVCGTTGEAATLSTKERLGLFESAVKISDGRVPVMAGTSASGTQETVDATAAACSTGVSHVLVATPAYNKPTQAGLLEHYKRVAEAAGECEVMLYNVPGRTACNMLPETVGKIAAACPNVTSIKEASGNLVQIANVRRQAPGITLMSGDDGVILPVLSLGGKGVVSVLSNAIPELVVKIVSCWEAGDRAEAEEAQLAIMPIFDAAFAESNPIPIKHALKCLGIGDGSLRLPMTAASESVAVAMERELKALGAIMDV